jgi:hypothetical protein
MDKRTRMEAMIAFAIYETLRCLAYTKSLLSQRYYQREVIRGFPLSITRKYLTDGEDGAQYNANHEDQEESSVCTGEPPGVEYRK